MRSAEKIGEMLLLHVGLEQEQSAAESALLQSRGGSCIAGARVTGQWMWEEKCGSI